jgi:pantoate--beta-alanine ligase
MLVTTTIAETRAALAKVRAQGQRIGFMPTLGYLHEGHLNNIEITQKHADFVVVSIFVNPTQFGPQEDFSAYPRDFERDRKLCESRGTDLIFLPSAEEMYPDPALITFHIEKMSKHLCGAKRPGHFEGVIQVVAKLFSIIQPDVAVFGQKDVQQLFIIKRMVTDLNFPIKIVAGPTIREPDGLAMSSRNVYLTPEQRRQSPILYQALLRARERIQSGERRASAVMAEMTRMIQAVAEGPVDYIEIVRTSDLQPIERLEGEFAIALAVYWGKARLIDNIVLEVHGDSVSEPKLVI